jgi:hypothetical protein
LYIFKYEYIFSLDRMRSSIRCLHNPNEDEIKLQLDGLEQV